MTSKQPVMLRLKAETIEELKNRAIAEHRSLNNLLEVIIAEYLAQHIEKQ